MNIFCCNDIFEDMLCCIYQAWENALICGHENVYLYRKKDCEYTLFDTYIDTHYNEEQFNKVVRSIINKISFNTYYYVYCALMSPAKDALDTTYRFLIKGFKTGPDIVNHLSDSTVMRMFELKRNVSSEICIFKEVTRFNSLNNTYVSHIEPKCNILSLIGDHFSDRMPSENWMIIDDTRFLALIHPKDCECYIKKLTTDEYEKLSITEQYNDEYTDMWKTFFNSIAIKQRYNPNCQKNHIPYWRRKHAVEFQI